MNKLIIFILLTFPLVLSAQFRTSKAFPDQYKKQNRDALRYVVDGKTDTIIQYFNAYLAAYPEDLESHYGLVVAFTQKKKWKKAMMHVKKSVDLGLPIERFIAGPRNLLASLTKKKIFKKYAKGKYTPLIHGPLLANFTDKSANIWVRTDEERPLKLKIDDQSYLARTTKEKDYTGVLTADNLKPNTTYHYELSIENKALQKGQFITFPKAEKAAKFQIGFGGGAGYTPQYERMWDTLSTHSLTAFCLMGDNVYHDSPKYPDIQDYCYYRRQSRAEYRRFSSQTPIFAIWDDHDFGDNDSYGGTKINEPYWKLPVWKKFKNQWPNPYYGGGNKNPGTYYDFSIADVDFFMMDTRFYRTNGKDKIKPDTMLGNVQKQWLFDKLLNSTATFKVIGTSIPITPGTKTGRGGLDTWDGFNKDREDLFTFIETNNIEGVFFMAADRHRSDAWKTERKKGYALYEFMSSRLTNIHTHPVQKKSMFGYSKTPSFGLLEFDTSRADPQVVYRIFSIENEEIHRFTLYKSQLVFEKKN